MPEIIEVKSYSDFIYKHTINDLLLNIKIKKGRYKNHGPFTLYKQLNKLLPLKIVNINSKGKFMYMTLENNYNIGITLGLMGGWFYKKNDSTKMIHGLSKSQYFLVEQYISKALKHLNIYFIFKLGILFFFDQLSFGTITIFTNKEELDEKLRSIGPDVLDINTTFDIFKEKIRQHKNYEKYIGNILVNQKILSGIGNYIRSDVLWLSMISPFRKIKNITINELYTIYYNIRSYIWGIYNYKKGIKLKMINYKDILPFQYERDFFIYSKETDIYNNIVTKEKLYEGSQIRYIFWVKTYQK